MMSIEQNIAKSLLDIEAVKLSPDKPFTWASGWKSPIYCDNRKILSYPSIRTAICNDIKSVIEKRYSDVEIIAGIATGAIAWGAIVAQMMDKPFIYVRASAKDHGLGNKIEGPLPQGAKVVVIEDLISTGMSSMAAVDTLQKSGALVRGTVAIFSYNFDKSRRAFENANVELYTLSNYDALLDEAVRSKYISESDLELLREWRFSPENWGQSNN
jgi:orotate phosphoribosyltransferase